MTGPAALELVPVVTAALRPNQIHQRLADLRRVRRGRHRVSGHAARRRAGAFERDAAARRARHGPGQRVRLGGELAIDLVLLPDLCIGAREEVVSVVLVSPQAAGAARRARRSTSARSRPAGATCLRIILERRYGVRPKYVDESDPLERALRGEPTLLIGDAAIDAIERFPAEVVYDLGRLWHEWTRPPDGVRRVGRAPRRRTSAIPRRCTPACTR